MTKSFSDGASLCLRAVIAAALLAASGCSSMTVPTAQSIAGLSPSGDVTVTEDFVTGLGGGSGTLNYQGQAYPFRVFGAVVGPGGGLSKITASGPVYNLKSVADFSGRYTEIPAPRV